MTVEKALEEIEERRAMAVHAHGDDLTERELRGRVQVIQRVMRDVMKRDTHYGEIPGTSKPTLLKPGAEILLSTFRLAVIPAVEPLDLGPDAIGYRVLARIVHAPTGAELGSGVGECSTEETKYKWRAPKCRGEYDAAPSDRRRQAWSKRGAYDQVRTEPRDQANTVLKMAKKRAVVDGVLSVLAASDMFEQDLEDTPIDVEPRQATVAPAAQDVDAELGAQASANGAKPKRISVAALKKRIKAAASFTEINDLSEQAGAVDDADARAELRGMLATRAAELKR